MLKLLLLAFGVWLIYSMLKRHAAGARRDDEARPSPPAQEDMVRCAVCGVHLPRSEASLSGDEFFCCDEHRRERRG